MIRVCIRFNKPLLHTCDIVVTRLYYHHRTQYPNGGYAMSLVSYKSLYLVVVYMDLDRNQCHNFFFFDTVHVTALKNIVAIIIVCFLL